MDDNVKGPTLDGVIHPGGCVTVARDGNVFNIMAYTANRLKKRNTQVLVERYYNEAASGDYDHAIRVSMAYLGDTDDEENNN